MKSRGFTLLELMIAAFILAMAAAILMGTQSTSLRLMGYANNTSVITMLTRAKMQDIEYEVHRTIQEDGVKEDYVEEYEGDYSDDGYPDIRWNALVQSIELTDEASNDFVESVTNQLYGMGDEGGTLSGNTTVTQFLPLMVSFMPTIINQLGQRIRKISLTTTWDYLGVEQTLTVSQFVVILDVGSADGVSGASVSGTTGADGKDTDTAGGTTNTTTTNKTTTNKTTTNKTTSRTTEGTGRRTKSGESTGGQP